MATKQFHKPDPQIARSILVAALEDALFGDGRALGDNTEQALDRAAYIFATLPELFRDVMSERTQGSDLLRMGLANSPGIRSADNTLANPKSTSPSQVRRMLNAVAAIRVELGEPAGVSRHPLAAHETPAPFGTMRREELRWRAAELTIREVKELLRSFANAGQLKSPSSQRDWIDRANRVFARDPEVAKRTLLRGDYRSTWNLMRALTDERFGHRVNRHLDEVLPEFAIRGPISPARTSELLKAWQPDAALDPALELALRYPDTIAEALYSGYYARTNRVTRQTAIENFATVQYLVETGGLQPSPLLEATIADLAPVCAARSAASHTPGIGR